MDIFSSMNGKRNETLSSREDEWVVKYPISHQPRSTMDLLGQLSTLS